MSRDYTIGMAGHIDHGKTALTKALTGVETDHLKEERERKISIEPGFAPFIQEESLEVTIIDVPGHERFIRQMIAGVAGIDAVLLVIAANEGMMPQTFEHVHILSRLGIDQGWIVLTKIDEVEEDLLEIVKEDVKEQLQDTFLEEAPIYLVDSLSGNGISTLKRDLQKYMKELPEKKATKPFRLPIDHVFTIRGQGVVVRGTVFDGTVSEGDSLTLLPQDQEVSVRQIQRHRQREKRATAGQRAAINLRGISHEEVARGDVLVEGDFYSVSDRMDVVFTPLKKIHYPIQQRQLVKLHMGTSEVMGRLIFFDRNRLKEENEDEVLCQLHLDEKIVASRGDRFILRRPTPVETLGGGWVIDAQAERHRFHPETIEQLRIQKEGRLLDRVLFLLEEAFILSENEIRKKLALSKEAFVEVKDDLLEINGQGYTSFEIVHRLKENLINQLKEHHRQYPMRIGIDRAEIRSYFSTYPIPLIDGVLDLFHKEGEWVLKEQYVALKNHLPTIPKEWQQPLQAIRKKLISQGAEPERWENLFQSYEVPKEIRQEYYHYLLENGHAYFFEEGRLIAKETVEKVRKRLAQETNLEDFTLQEAREILNLSRKNLIPMLELLDGLGDTKRVANKRTWL